MIFALSSLLVILIILSAFFSSAETSFLSISRIMLRTMQKNKVPKTEKIIRIKSDTEKFLTTILIGNNFVNNFASSLATAIAVSISGEKGVAIATGVMTVIILIFGEILPKTMAAAKPLETAQKAASIITFLEIILSPVSFIFICLSRFAKKAFSKLQKHDTPLITEDDLKTLIDVGNQEGTLEKSEREMMYKIFEFTDLRVRDITRHRSLVNAVSINASYKETVSAFTKSGYSRLPVYEGDFNTVLGIIHYKDILFSTGKKSKSFTEETNLSFSVRNCMRQVLFVPETKTALSLLHTFKTEKQNFAIVVDEHGSNSGIVTMDDLLNAVFGRITDEYTENESRPEDRITVISASDFLVPGDILLSDVNNIFRLNLISDYYDTFGGWLLEQFGNLPSTGEMIKKGNWFFIIEEQAQRRIRSVRMRLVE